MTSRGGRAARRALLAAVAGARLALAQGTPATPPIVRVFVAGPPEAIAATRAAIEDLCSRANVAVLVRDAAGADQQLLSSSHPPGLAEAYVDLRPGGSGHVIVVDAESRQTLERRTLPSQSTLEMSIETAASVVCTAVESALSTGAREAGRQPEPPAPTPATTPERVPARGDEGVHEAKPRSGRPSMLDPRVSVFGVVSGVGPRVTPGGGAAFELVIGNGALRPAASLSLAAYAPGEAKGLGGEASFGFAQARLLPTMEWQAARTLSLFLSAGGGIDWVRVTDAAAPQGGTARPGTGTVTPTLTGMLGSAFWLGSRAGVLLAGGIDVNLLRHAYVAETPSGPNGLYEPSLVAPFALAGLFVSFHGSGETAPNGGREP